MLVDFSFENYRIFRDEQTFSMIPTAQSLKEHKLYHISTAASSTQPFLHRHAAIYGANGAGKTTLVNAMKFFRQFILDSHDAKAFDSINVSPFIYDTKAEKCPSTFSVTFLRKDILYRYGYTLNQQQVLDEFLVTRPPNPSRSRLLYHRRFEPEEKIYKWRVNSKFFGRNLKSLQSYTRPNALFLSTAIQLNNDTLKPIYKWLISKPVYLTHCYDFLKIYTARLCYDPKTKPKILNFFKTMDARIEDIIVRTSFSQNEILFNKSFDVFSNNYSDTIDIDPEFEVFFVRKNNEGRTVCLRLEDESQGMQTLFYIAARFLKAIEKGRTVIIDEINTNMHPILFAELIKMFDGVSYPNNKAQLIFTTHDVAATEQDCVNPSQIWMVNRKSDLSSELYTFSDVDVPKNVDFRRGYLQGRYGATPKIVRYYQ